MKYDDFHLFFYHTFVAFFLFLSQNLSILRHSEDESINRVNNLYYRLSILLAAIQQSTSHFFVDEQKYNQSFIKILQTRIMIAKNHKVTQKRTNQQR